MPIIRWDESFLTGITEFDQHHEHLVDLLNRTYDMLIIDEPAENTGRVVNDLRAYAGYHFVAEEQWMLEQGYPDREEHCKQHHFFCREVDKFQKDLAEGKDMVGVEVLSFLVEWLSNHILKVDTLYRDFYEKNKPR